MHNDIKPENIMIQKDTYVPKLIDFGLTCTINKVSKEQSEGKYPEDHCIRYAGTLLYVAPEYIKYKGLKIPASDMWSLGVTLYTAATGNRLYKARNVQELIKEIKDFDNGPIPRLNTSNELLNTIVNNLLLLNPSERLKPKDIVEMVDKNARKPESMISRDRI